MSFKYYRPYCSHGHNFSLFNPIFSNRYNYMMSQELPQSISTRETSKLEIVVVITKEKILFRIPSYFLVVTKFENLPLRPFVRQAFALLTDGHQLEDLPLHRPSRGIPRPQRTTIDGRGVLMFPLVLFIFPTSGIPTFGFGNNFDNFLW